MQNSNTVLDDINYAHLSSSKTIYGQGDLPLLVIDHEQLYAVLSLQGAQLLSFVPRDDKDWLWLSPLSTFAKNRSPRGGIPVCMPWFGVNRNDPDKPRHGFARNRPWELLSISESENTVSVHLGFTYQGNETLFGHAFVSDLWFHMRRQELQLELNIKHLGLTAAQYSWALHTYFSIDTLDHAVVTGLDQQTFLDNTDGLSRKTQHGDTQLNKGIDAVFCATEDPQILEASRPLVIDGDHCPSCIIWNPGQQLAKEMQDIGEHYKDFVCIERGCAFDDELFLLPQQDFHARLSIRRKG